MIGLLITAHKVFAPAGGSCDNSLRHGHSLSSRHWTWGVRIPNFNFPSIYLFLTIIWFFSVMCTRSSPAASFSVIEGKIKWNLVYDRTRGEGVCIPSFNFFHCLFIMTICRRWPGIRSVLWTWFLVAVTLLHDRLLHLSCRPVDPSVTFLNCECLLHYSPCPTLRDADAV